MLQEQPFVQPPLPRGSRDARKLSKTRTLPQRILRSLLFAFGVLLGAGLVLVLVLLLLNTQHHPGGASISSALALLLHAPLLLILLCLLFIATFGSTLFGTRLYALWRYARAVEQVQKRFQLLYTPLEAMANIRPTAEQNHHEVTAPTIAVQSEHVSILDLLEQSYAHQLILGVPGAGKTMALRVYQYRAVTHPWRLIFRRGYIPVFVPMKNYSLYLKRYSEVPQEAWVDSNIGLLSFLQESDLPGMEHLAPYLRQLAQQGRLLLLCDGLNEVDSNYLTYVSHEMAELMLHSKNRLVMTCREIDYREQPEFMRLVARGQAACATIYPLQPEQIQQFIERYIVVQDQPWRHTAGQIMQVIDRSRLRYHCTNPMMLFTLMEIIDQIGVERGKQIDTRGRLLRESVVQLVARERRQGRWQGSELREQLVIRFLSVVACAARWANDRNAIQLSVSSASGRWREAELEAFADELIIWLNENPAQGPYPDIEEPDALEEMRDDLPQLLQFTMTADLIDISPNGVLSFRHELIAEYFVAEYFQAAEQQTTKPEIREELLENVGRWSEPVAIWAGLLDDPLVLAEQLGSRGLENRVHLLQALSLALVCVGVLWTPPQADAKRLVMLPPSVEEALSIAVRNRAAREELARIFTRCAEEGGQEVYRSLLPLIMVAGVDDLLLLLDKAVVPVLLFSFLEDVVDDVAYEAQVKHLTQVLGRFGAVVVDHAVELSRPHAERSTRMRASAVNILGGTYHPRAVEPLIERLQDTDIFVMRRATNALYRLGPELTLKRLLQVVEQRDATVATVYMHLAALAILERFMSGQDMQRRVTQMQYLRIVEAIVPMLTSNYQQEPQTQQRARDILVRQALQEEGASSRADRGEKVIDALLLYLPSQNEVAVGNVVQALRAIGPLTTPKLLPFLRQPSEEVRLRVLDVLKETRDLEALPDVLQLLTEAGPTLVRRVSETLYAYAPDSIPGLLESILHATREDSAERAASILKLIGEPAIAPMIEALSPVVLGRTRILVQVLADMHATQAVTRFIELVQTPPDEPLLTIALVRALSQFREPHVVSPLLQMLTSTHPQILEEAIEALSQLGEVALPALIDALDTSHPSQQVQRVQRAILGMNPFPGEELIEALALSSDSQASALLTIFRMRADKSADVLVQHLLSPDQRIQSYLYQALEELPGVAVVPALINGLAQPALREPLSPLLLKHPDVAIARLVELLGAEELGEVAAELLPRFGPGILRPLVEGLDDRRQVACTRAQEVIVALVHQHGDTQTMLTALVKLFALILPDRVREVLFYVLTNELAAISLPALLEGLETAQLLEGVAEALKRLVYLQEHRERVLDSLVEALKDGERRRGAMLTLVQIGAPAVPKMGELITSHDAMLVRSSKEVLRDLGVVALPFIMSALSDYTSLERREAALEVFNTMSPQNIKEQLVTQLSHDDPSDMGMAVTLLLQRIMGESDAFGDRAMVSDLIAHIQTHTEETTNLRLLALLLLLGEPLIVTPLLQALDSDPRQSKLLTALFLLLGRSAQDEALQVFKRGETALELREELAAVLGMNTMSGVIQEYAQSTHLYGPGASRPGMQQMERLSVALRALGGLLAGGQWDVPRLRELRERIPEGAPEHELFSMLLGVRYGPQIQQLKRALRDEQETHEKQLLLVIQQAQAEKERADKLDSQLEELKQEHTEREGDLERGKRERQKMQGNITQLTRENDSLSARLEQMTRERDSLQRERDTLSGQLRAFTGEPSSSADTRRSKRR
ncbi:HEAT repeat domain-containing protein [Ktedonobacter robiniae]|uniref:HEAT repeat domain-containing protein n=1 Tax=Ktedonobacter robiniae TaxID=2778365 RepID=UPI0019167BB7|nr:HEAT repeat domain-containing protein [Ktedonobacter robiniae]